MFTFFFGSQSSVIYDYSLCRKQLRNAVLSSVYVNLIGYVLVYKNSEYFCYVGAWPSH